MIAASGLANDVEPGVIMIARAITGAHHTSPTNDAPALVGAPRIDLRAYEATDLGAWAASTVTRVLALAQAAPCYTGAWTVLVDDDPDGGPHATELARCFQSYGSETRLIIPAAGRLAA
jgi:hypothetical protein